MCVDRNQFDPLGIRSVGFDDITNGDLCMYSFEFKGSCDRPTLQAARQPVFCTAPIRSQKGSSGSAFMAGTDVCPLDYGSLSCAPGFGGTVTKRQTPYPAPRFRRHKFTSFSLNNLVSTAGISF